MLLCEHVIELTKKIVCTCYRVTKRLLYVHVIELTRGYCMYMLIGLTRRIVCTCYRVTKRLLCEHVIGLVKS